LKIRTAAIAAAIAERTAEDRQLRRSDAEKERAKGGRRIINPRRPKPPERQLPANAFDVKKYGHACDHNTQKIVNAT
jgi:hypothetical protein